MKNTERQTKLDELKYLESEKECLDKSGLMDYCAFCTKQRINDFKVLIGDCCKATQEERVANSLCAKAYNKLHYGKRK